MSSGRLSQCDACSRSVNFGGFLDRTEAMSRCGGTRAELEMCSSSSSSIMLNILLSSAWFLVAKAAANDPYFSLSTLAAFLVIWVVNSVVP